MEDYQRLIKNLYPQQSTHQKYLKIFVDAIDCCKEIAPGKWAVHLRTDGNISLIIGGLYVALLWKGCIGLSLAKRYIHRLLDNSDGWSWETWNKDGSFKRLKARFGYLELDSRSSELVRLTHIIVTANKQFIKLAAKYYEKLSSNFKNNGKLEEQIRLLARTVVKKAQIETSRSKAQGFMADAEKRRCIERYAVDKAREWFSRKGYKVTERGKPYDLECVKGDGGLFVEVKGTTQEGERIELTDGEVRFARKNKGRMVLFILGEISVVRVGSLRAKGGKRKVIRNWNVDRGKLRATQYFYYPSVKQ